VKVVIAGGTGLIGTAVSHAFVDDGHEVLVLTRGRSRQNASCGLRFMSWDPSNNRNCADALAGADAVINLAGASIGRWPWTSRRKRQLRESRLTSTRCLVEAIASLRPDARPRVLLNASGTDIYEGHDAEPADEDATPSDSFLARLCLDWEAEARKAENLGVRVVLMRTSSVVAQGAPYVRVISLPFRFFLGGRLGSGRQWVSWIDIADVVRLYLWALESDAICGPLNVSAPDPRPQALYADALGVALHRPAWFWTPAWIIRVLLGDQATLPLGSRRVWPAKAMAAGYRFQRPRLEESLGVALQSNSR
jgi:uncharacterized protein (TIGR01777 family)